MYELIKLDTAAPKEPKASILIIYTGGTFGMGADANGSLRPFDFNEILSEIPSLKSFDLIIQVLAFHHPIDSSNVRPDHWVKIGELIQEHYKEFDGFVVLHGTDTMAYTASALSYMLENLSKPVIFTGAQLPIAAARTDARENLVTAIEIASNKTEAGPRVPEVCIYFNYLLIRGNRSKKVESQHFDAFESENYPPLAKSGVSINYAEPYIQKFGSGGSLNISKKWETNVTYLKLFPGISREVVDSVMGIANLKGLVMETYGSGNAPTEPWFLSLVKEYVDKRLLIFNVSQCLGGRVIQGKYETSRTLQEVGVIGGRDITSEAAITKMMYLLGREANLEKVKKLLRSPLRGEMSL